MPSYYGDPNAQQPEELPVLRMPMTPPVRVSLPAPRGGSSGGGNLAQAIDMKKIAALLQQKWGAGAGAGAGGDPDPDQPYLDAAASLDALSGPTSGDPDPDLLYLPKTAGGI